MSVLTDQPIGVLFVCLGNICRSPSAQGIFQQRVNEANLQNYFAIDSCGTAPFNVGKSPDDRTLKATKKYGYDISEQVARQINDEDFKRFQYIIAMDRKNLMTLAGWQPKDFNGELQLFMHYHRSNKGMTQIPDPYHESIEHFYPIIETIEQASIDLLSYIREQHNL